MRKKHIIIFDVDGTLTYIKKPNHQIFWETLKKLTVTPPTLEMTKKAFEKTDLIYQSEGCKWDRKQDKMFRDLNIIQLNFCGIKPTKKFLDAIENAYNQADNHELFPDVLPLLKKLKIMKYPLGILTKGLSSDIDKRLKHLGVYDFFQHIACTGTLPYKKPATEAFVHILELMGCKSVNSVYIGDDYEIDFVGAKNAGLRAILLDRNNIHPEIIKNRITNLSKLKL